MSHSGTRHPTLWQALLPVLIMIVLLALTLVKYQGTPHLPLIGASAAASFMGLYLGYTWKQIEEGIIDGILIALQACLILLIIGILIGAWISGGIVPTMIYYGLQILSPSVFLPATFIICSVVSLATGSSWSTAGTVGIALIGVGKGLGIPLPMVAGAIISGSYFGDKMSPLSDTTNLAPAVAGTDLFSHVRHMIYTTGPSTLIALILYSIIGWHFRQGAMQQETIDQILNAIRQHFFISPFLLVPTLLVILMVLLRIPALPALLAGGLIGMLCALFFQHTPIKEILSAAQNGYICQTGVAAVDDLLSRGGLESMLPTIALIMCALSFGGILEKIGILAVLASAILKIAHNTGMLVLSTILTCIGMNIIAPDQYLSIVVPGRMYRSAYERSHLKAKNLSRALEDAGTLSSPLIPWNTCGAYMWVTLGVHPFSYLPFAFLNLINPLVSIVLAFTGLTMEKEPEENLKIVKESQQKDAEGKSK